MDEKRQLLHYGLLEPLSSCLEPLLLVVLHKILIKSPLEDLILLFDIVLLESINVVVTAFGTRYELFSSSPSLATPPCIPRHLHLIIFT